MFGKIKEKICASTPKERALQQL